LQRSEVRCMKQALRKLPRRVRKMLHMHYAHGIKLQIIGGSYGMTESRVSQILSQALAHLRVKMT
jgi:RNA polymerase sigma factor (sigma-70 family)